MSDQSFGAPSFSMNFSSGPVTGEGFGATPPPSGPGGPAPVEVPPPAPGGGAAAPPPAAPAAPAPTAATRDKMYKTASSIMNGIYNEIISITNLALELLQLDINQQLTKVSLNF